jgi:hypothetical protein
MFTRTMCAVALLALGLCVTAGTAVSQESALPEGIVIPSTATVLEGMPTVRIDSTESVTTRHLLKPDEADKSRLKVSVIDGRYYWTSRDNRLLQLDSSGPFTYLSSEPGRYIRFRRLNDHIAYVEHIDTPVGSTTWWGELRIR